MNKRECDPDMAAATMARSFDLDRIVKAVCDTYQDSRGINHIEGFNLPAEEEVLAILHDLMEVIFPGYRGKKSLSLSTVRFHVGEILARVSVDLRSQIIRAANYNCKMEHCDDCNVPLMAGAAVEHLLNRLPEIREILKTDVMAAFEGDPAAKTLDEIVLSYPGVRAITIQRIAHELYAKNVPLIPRMMGEYAHRITGIDIHPGATIGRFFFIDHGTGVVIGETTDIGERVKIYQGVTLGALSFPKDGEGNIIKGVKRHPNIEDDVTIYSGATILGNITIGRGAVIGGNVWLTESVSPGTTITIAKPELRVRARASVAK
jgi:serine O-acetyltransferase